MHRRFLGRRAAAVDPHVSGEHVVLELRVAVFGARNDATATDPPGLSAIVRVGVDRVGVVAADLLLAAPLLARLVIGRAVGGIRVGLLLKDALVDR